MNRFFESIYYGMPVPFQNLMVSIKGLQLERIRKRGLYNEYKQEIAARKNWSRKEFDAYQFDELTKLVDFAAHNIPYYQRVFGPKVGVIASHDSLARLPLLRRETVKANPYDFIEVGTKSKIIVHTTGTTGSPLAVACDADSRQRNYAYFDAYLESLGLDTKAKHVIIGGRVVVSPEATKPPFWRESKFQNSLLMSSYHLSDELLDFYVDKISAYGPEYIESYPSSIFTIARHMLKAGRQIEVKAIVTSAETLFPDQREIIEKAFRTTVYDQYGCAEMSLFVGQCAKGRYHVRPDYGCVELVDDGGEPVPLGEVGNVVCTGLINRRMPLIRYVIGDRAVMDPNQSCACGLETPILKAVFGRKDDVLITGDGRYVGRMSPVLKGLPVKEAQYIQRTPGEVVVQIVPDNEFDPGRDMDSVRTAVVRRLGRATQIEIRLVQSLDRGRGGKLQSVISHVDDSDSSPAGRS